MIDFGVAKATQGRLTDHTHFIAFEQFIGAPAYIYSLGELWYELLVGGTPFDQKELLAVGLDEMRRTICEKGPPKPSTRLTQGLVAAVVRRSIQTPKAATRNPEKRSEPPHVGCYR